MTLSLSQIETADLVAEAVLYWIGLPEHSRDVLLEKNMSYEGDAWGSMQLWAREFVKQAHALALRRADPLKRVELTPAKITFQFDPGCEFGTARRGAAPAPPAKQETWRDRPPLL